MTDMNTTLARARDGDAAAFRALTDPYRRELHVHCYRMLGSVTDADDMLQETLLAAWRGLPGFQERAALRTWLYRIATNRCLNALRAARRTPVEPIPPFVPPEPTRRGAATWLQPYPDALLDELPDHQPGPAARYQAREAVELAFVAALQQLPPRQAAALLLRDVLGYATAEAAELLGTSALAVKGALQRARAALGENRGRATAFEPGSAAERELARRFAEAFSADDIDGVLALLTDDAWLRMPPAPHEYQGAAIGTFLRTVATWRNDRRFQLLPTRANNHPAFGCYLADSGAPLAHSAGLIVLGFDHDRIAVITHFLDTDLAPRFGLPDTIPAGQGPTAETSPAWR
ncbi:RNA polymerase subunit sigma-70 [Nocardia iowensis]|nr:RNA polymerase subunit sigma-70 [Nocardia iowensis]